MAFRITPTLTASAPTTLVAVSLLVGCSSLFFNWLFWARFHVDIPLEDTLSLLPTVQSIVETGWSSITFQEWVAPHASAHRIAVARLLMAAEYKYLSGENNLFYLGCWLSIGALCYLYFRASKLSNIQYNDIGFFMLGMALIYTCSYTLTRNLISPINTLWYMSAACSAFSIYLFVSPTGQATLLRAATSCLFALIASYSTFLGVIACLVLVALAIQARSRHAIWIAGLMVPFVALYVTDLKTFAVAAIEAFPEGQAFDSFTSRIKVFIDFRKMVFDFTVTFLSSPKSNSPTVLSYIYVIPSVFLILYGWGILGRQWYLGESHSKASVKFYLAMSTILLGTSISCSLGRTGFSTPTMPRYQTIVMLYWLSIGGLMLHTLPGRKIPYIKMAYMLLILMMPVGLLYQQSTFDLFSVVRASSSAKRIELSTRLGLPLFKDSRDDPNVYVSPYIQHEAFLSRNTNLSANVQLETDGTQDAPDTCNSMHIRIHPQHGTPKQIRTVKLTIDGDRFQRFREVRIAGQDGGLGYLYATPLEPLSVSKLLWDDTAWKGFYRGYPDSTSLTLIFDAVIGPDYRCQLNTNS